MADIDDHWDDVVIDNQGKILPPKRKPIGQEDLPDPRRLLPQALLAKAIGKAEMQEIVEHETYCLIVEAPSSDWVAPILHEVNKAAEWDKELGRTETPRSKTDDGEALIKQLASGGRVFAVSQDLRLLPAPIRNTADRIVKVPAITAPIIAAVIKKITGTLPIDVLANLGIGLEFSELVTCLRPGSTAAECMDRLKTAAQRKMGANGDRDVPDLNQLHGYGAAMDWATELVDDLEAWRRGEIPWSSLSAAVVLSSQPGLGKTSMMQSLAKSCGVPMVATSVADWFSNGSGYLDSVVKQIDEAFSQARSRAPCILFLDEIDALPSRITVGPRNADYWGVVIGKMLTLLDGAVGGQTEGVIVIGATNHGGRLDPALVRPGRLSRIINIEQPDEKALAGILRQHLGEDLAGQDLSVPARLAMGASGATCVEYVKTARRRARKHKRAVELDDLIGAIAPGDVRAPELIERIATHEAGHAVICHAVRLAKVSAISIVSNGSSGGFVLSDYDDGPSTRGEVERLVMQTLAGRAAEQIILGEPGTGSGGGANSDLATATRCIAVLHLSTAMGEEFIYHGEPKDVLSTLPMHPHIEAAVEQELRHLYAMTLQMVRVHADAIVAVAEELLLTRHLGGQQFLDVLATIKAPREWPAAQEDIQHG